MYPGYYLVEPGLVPEPHPVELSGLVGVGEGSGHDDRLVLGEHDAFDRVVVVLINHLELGDVLPGLEMLINRIDSKQYPV